MWSDMHEREKVTAYVHMCVWNLTVSLMALHFSYRSIVTVMFLLNTCRCCFYHMHNKTETVFSVYLYMILVEWTTATSICKKKKKKKKFFNILYLKYLHSLIQWGAADAEIKVPSGENTELKRSPFQAWSRSVYSHTSVSYTHLTLPTNAEV